MYPKGSSLCCECHSRFWIIDSGFQLLDPNLQTPNSRFEFHILDYRVRFQIPDSAFGLYVIVQRPAARHRATTSDITRRCANAREIPKPYLLIRENEMDHNTHDFPRPPPQSWDKRNGQTVGGAQEYKVNSRIRVDKRTRKHHNKCNSHGLLNDFATNTKHHRQQQTDIEVKECKHNYTVIGCQTETQKTRQRDIASRCQTQLCR